MAFSKEKAHDRAERYAAKGQHDKAAREYQTIVDHDPKDVRAWLMLADCLARSGDSAGALSRYLQVANFYAEQREHQKALAVYRQVLNIDPGRLDIHYRCANLNLELGRQHDAIANLEHVAQVQMQAGKVSDALDTYRQIADADPSIVSKRLRLAELCSREKRTKEAVEAFRQAGQVLLQTGRKADFVRVAERLLWHDTGDRQTIRELSRVYLELGDPRRALMKLNALLQIDASDVDGLELLAETFIALGKPDKASSVLVELVRELGDGNPERARAVLERGLGWIPGDPELMRLHQQFAGTSAPADDDDEVMELDAEDAEVLELDEDDLIMEEVSTETTVPTDTREAESREPPMTASVLSDLDNAPSEAASVSVSDPDLDKILFEARVYVKYRLFEHALEHVGELLGRAPEHVGALALKARAYGELGRSVEAADTHVTVARLVCDRDPKLAREHLEAALEQVPEQAAALAMLGDLQSTTAAVPEPAATSESVPLDFEGDGDSGAFDLVDDDFSIDVAEPEPEPAATGQRTLERPPVENRFGLSEAGPLPSASNNFSEMLDDEETGLHHVETRSDSAAMDLRVDTDLLTLDDGQPSSTPAAEVASAEHPSPQAESGPALDEFDLSPEAFAGVELEHRESAPELAPASGTEEELDALMADLAQDAVGEPTPEPARRATPEVAPKPAAGVPSRVWPDISDDLAEVRFFIDQGLDEDARAALSDLKEKAPGHPEVAKLEADLTGVTQQPVPVEESGAVPLLDLVSEEDAEADAYLSSIFGDDAEPAQAPKRQVEVKARAADVAGANARDHFDLGMAYREMGLVDEALTQFESAATDPVWRSRSLVMAGVLRTHRGETAQAVEDLQEAIDAAATEDERCEAQYELAVLYEKVGDTASAIAHLQDVTAGYRDRDERLVALQG